MYSTCIFCKRDLGDNILLEQFPVGRRIAFDEARGRLWVVCPHCSRWNLSPLEERWEVIEQCERFFSRSMRRVSTDHIGLSLHSTGVSLIRIGAPKRPEMAAWRYGDQLLNRRRQFHRSKVWAGTAFLLGWPIFLTTLGYHSYQKRKTLLRTDGVDGTVVRLSGRHARLMRLVPSADSWQLEVGPVDAPLVIAHEYEALRVAGQLLPWVNQSGSSADGVERAVRQIERAGSPEALFQQAAARLQDRYGARMSGEGLVRRAPEELKLALEMAAHEDLELQAAHGELEQLERAWREADEIARIADSLLLPDSVQRMLHRLHGRVRG
jgi:hypothetical protein